MHDVRLPSGAFSRRASSAIAGASGGQGDCYHYVRAHAPEENLPKEKCPGSASARADQQFENEEPLREKTRDGIRVAEAQVIKPPLKRIFTFQDMEVRLP